MKKTIPNSETTPPFRAETLLLTVGQMLERDIPTLVDDVVARPIEDDIELSLLRGKLDPLFWNDKKRDPRSAILCRYTTNRDIGDPVDYSQLKDYYFSHSSANGSVPILGASFDFIHSRGGKLLLGDLVARKEEKGGYTFGRVCENVTGSNSAYPIHWMADQFVSTNHLRGRTDCFLVFKPPVEPVDENILFYFGIPTYSDEEELPEEALYEGPSKEEGQEDELMCSIQLLSTLLDSYPNASEATRKMAEAFGSKLDERSELREISPSTMVAKMVGLLEERREEIEEQAPTLFNDVVGALTQLSLVLEMS